MAYFSLVKKLSKKSDIYKSTSGTKKVKKMNTSSLLGATHQSKILTWKSAFRLFFSLKTTTTKSAALQSTQQLKKKEQLHFKRSHFYVSNFSPSSAAVAQQLVYPINLSILKIAAASSDQMSCYWAFSGYYLFLAQITVERHYATQRVQNIFAPFNF